MLRKREVGTHKKQAATVVNWLPSHAQGRGARLLAEMVTDPDSPVERYGGGHRDNVRLTGVEDAVRYLADEGGEIPFGFD